MVLEYSIFWPWERSGRHRGEGVRVREREVGKEGDKGIQNGRETEIEREREREMEGDRGNSG